MRRNRNVGGSGLTSWSPGATLVARIGVRGNDLLRNPILNRGTAFTDAERRALGLVGLLSTGVSSIEAQVRRAYASDAGDRGERGGAGGP